MSAALLKAVLAAPDDDLPRLVYADWLDENGDPSRAEFIRTQIELAKLPDHDPRYRALEDREHELLSEHEPGWLGELAKYPREWEWRRGFVDEVTISGYNMAVDEDAAALGTHPITGCRIYRTPEEREPSYAADFFGDHASYDHPWMNSLRRLDVSPRGDGIDVAAGLFDHPRLGGVVEWDLRAQPGLNELERHFRRGPRPEVTTSLALGGRSGPTFQWGGHNVAVLDTRFFVQHFAAAPMEKLAVFDSGIDANSLATLLAAPFARTLRHLDISDNPIAPDAYRAFQQCHPAMRLDKLDVSGTPLAGISLEPLLNARSLEALTKLEMNGCGSARRNMEVLSRSAFWTQATELRAHSGTIPASTLEPLCHSAGPPGLRLLDLADNYLRTEGVRMLCNSPWAGSLTWLALSRNYLDDESCEVLAKSGRFTNLRTLHLAHNHFTQDGADGEQITSRGVMALAESPSLANLRLLTLSYTGITDAAVDVVVNAPFWRLFGLGVGGCNLSPAAVRILANSPRLNRLVWLDISDNPRLRGQALRPLADSQYLSRMCELDCGGIDIADDVRAVFRERLGPRFSL
jgi:uncharacterized protein (TIGR02996 family)